jgi:hypothetical protein
MKEVGQSCEVRIFRAALSLYCALEEDEDGIQHVKRYAVTWKVR